MSGSYLPPPPPGYQPPPSYTPGPSGPPPTYLVHAILVTLFCCLPLGIVSLISASKVSSLYRAGDHAGAYQESEKAKRMALIGFGVGLAFGVLWALVG